VAAAAFSVASMFGLVGVMALARPLTSTAVGTSDVAGATSAAVPGSGAAAPPVALTARPRVQVTTLTTDAPTARTNGSR
jgi:hypothetical protein